MLELYKDGQPIFYNMVNNAIKNNKLSHAYILILMVILMLWILFYLFC